MKVRKRNSLYEEDSCLLQYLGKPLVGFLELHCLCFVAGLERDKASLSTHPVWLLTLTGSTLGPPGDGVGSGPPGIKGMGMVVGLREDWRSAACAHGPSGLVCPLQASPSPAPLWLLCQGPTAASCGRGPQPRMGLSCCAGSPTRGTVGHLPPASLWADLVLSSQSTYSQVGWFPLHSTWASQTEDDASSLWGM